jgi:hypothetical protein
MRCGHAIKIYGSKWLQSALTATNFDYSNSFARILVQTNREKTIPKRCSATQQGSNLLG